MLGLSYRPSVVSVRSGRGRTRTVRRARAVIASGAAEICWRDPRFYRDETLVEWSSITKTVTARLLSELVRSGEIDPMMKVADLFPYLRLNEVTLWDLSRHRAGLPLMHPGASSGLLRDPCRGANDERLLERCGAQIVDASRGRAGEFHYSNLSYAILGLAIEKMTGRAWIELVRERVLPAERFRSVTLVPEPMSQMVPRLLGIRRTPWSMSDGIYRAAGGLWSSFDDLIAYACDAMETGQADGWFHLRGSARYHTGQARDTGVCVILDPQRSRIGVAHAVFRAPNAAKRLLEDAMFARDI